VKPDNNNNNNFTPMNQLMLSPINNPDHHPDPNFEDP
jgi:hypothetical protein